MAPKRFLVSIVAFASLVALVRLMPAERPSVAVASPPDGAKIYASRCLSCHQPNGQGTPGSFPPLAKNPYVTGDPKLVIGTVLNGMHGSVTVDGKTYNSVMPSWKGHLSNSEIAAVVSYVRGAWGNDGSPVTENQVAAELK